MTQALLYKKLKEITKDSFEVMSLHEVETIFESVFNEARDDFPARASASAGGE